jgi:tetratricopeptide (TPR) repeat protein
LAVYYGKNQHFGEALEFQKQSLMLQQSFENPIGIAIALNNLGVTYFRLGQLDDAQKHYEQAIQTMLESQLPVRQSMYDNLAEVNAALMAALMEGP